MLVYVDSVICIYAVEGLPPFQAIARSHLASITAAGDQFAICDLTWLECRIKPIRTGDADTLAAFEEFLNASDFVRLPMSTAVFDRACRIRASHSYGLADALHLATAIEGGCGRFLTNDLRLAGFLEIPIEVLKPGPAPEEAPVS